MKNFALLSLFAVILLSAFYLFKNPAEPPQNAFSPVEPADNASVYSIFQELSEKSGKLKTLRSRLHLSAESSSPGSAGFGFQDCEELGLTLNEIGQTLATMSGLAYSAEYLSQIKAAEESLKTTAEENVRIKTWLSGTVSTRRKIYKRLGTLEEALTILQAHLVGLLKKAGE